MFQGTQGNINDSTAATVTDPSFTLDIDNSNTFAKPLANMPKGHENYSPTDFERCPVMSGKIKPPVQQEEDEEEGSDSDSSEDEEINQGQMPAGHEEYSEKDKEKCPVMSGKIKNPQAGDDQGDGQQKKKKKKKLQSGCPFMPAENKKNPALAHLEPSFEIPYISTLRHLFTFRGIIPKKSNGESRQNFETYPIFLKHTLFHNEEHFKKIRKLEVSHRFFVYDKFREQGNKKYNRNHPEEAISLYEHALSCFKWLEIKPEEKKEDEEETKEDPLANLKPMNKALVSVLSDKNVALCDGEELTDGHEIEMRNSMLMNIYLALACAYLKLNHYNAAIVAIEEGLKITTSSSQLYFRRSQARAYNKGSTLEDLYKAKEDIEKAIEIKHQEKLFQQEPGILKIMNVHNAGEIYVEHAHFVEKLIKEKRDEIKTGLRFFFSKVREIEYIEEAILKDGKVPQENENELAVEIHEEEIMEVDVIKEMINKYYKIIEFYLETEKKDQVAIARKEVQNVLEAYNKMKMYMAIDFKSPEKDPLLMEVVKDFEINLSKPRTQARLDKLRMNKVKEIFENGNFNLEVFQYAVKDYFKKKEEREKKKKEKRQNDFKDNEKPSKAKWVKQLFGVEFGLQMFVLILLFGLFWYWNKNTFFGSTTTAK